MSFPIENIKSCSSLEHGPKSDKSASAFLKLCFHVCLKVLKKFKKFCSSYYFSKNTKLRLPLPQRFQKAFAYKSKH